MVLFVSYTICTWITCGLFPGKMALKAEAEGIPACHLGISHGSTGYARLGCGIEIIELMEREQ